jgi:hypothetical protein
LFHLSSSPLLLDSPSPSSFPGLSAAPKGACYPWIDALPEDLWQCSIRSTSAQSVRHVRSNVHRRRGAGIGLRRRGVGGNW